MSKTVFKGPHWEIITPEKAKEYLKKNVKNYRCIKPHLVKAYAREMLAGNWRANGEPIVFGTDGYLQNGQHRLQAIVESGVTVRLLVVDDAEPCDIYDVGGNRTCHDVLLKYGVPMNGIEIGIGRIMSNGGITSDKSVTGIVVNYCVENEELIRKAYSIVSTGGSVGKKSPCATVVYCMLKNGEMPETEMRDFFSIVNKNNVKIITKNPSPAFVLHKQLKEAKGGGLANQKKQLEVTFKALNDFHANNPRCKVYTYDTNHADRLIKEINGFQTINKAG